MTRSTQDVVESHLAAVVAGDAVGMAADYGDNAVLERLGAVYRGKSAIAEYFATVPERLGDGRVMFDTVEIQGDTVTFSWYIEGAVSAASGTDVCRIVNGEITHQVVHLDVDDF